MKNIFFFVVLFSMTSLFAQKKNIQTPILASWEQFEQLEKNGFDVSDQSQNSLKNQLNVIYNKFKVNKKFIIMTGCGISTNLRVAKLKAFWDCPNISF